MPHHPVPFPSAGNGEGIKTTDGMSGMSIEIPGAGTSSGSNSSLEERKEQQHSGVSSGPRSFHHHHPRQPGVQSEGYFPGGMSGSSAGGHGPKTPGTWGRHSRNASQSSALSAMTKGNPMTGSLSNPSHAQHTHSHDVPTDSYDWQQQQQQQGGWPSGGGGLPSPSTLTDILLGLHATLYGAKRSPEEVREMVWRFYDADATFESPLLSAKGREQVANQFIMAFALPGMDVTSELRDVICSDFEFDGTRAGIIDQTISVTFFPSVFGSSSPVPPSSAGPHAHEYPQTPSHPHQPHSAITPHPFADYRTPGASAYGHASHSPTTPFSLSGYWGGGSSRPHTPGGLSTSAGIRPFTSTSAAVASARPENTPPGVNADDTEGLPLGSVFASADQTGGGGVSRLRMPLDAVAPHWAHEGLGRSTVANLLWGVLHPRAVLKQLCTINLRLMSRLEFNDAGHIVRHEDTWGLRESIEGTIPFASLFYALERRVVGYIVSWAIAKGFSLSAALTPRAIGGPESEGNEVALLGDHYQQMQHSKDRGYTANDAAHALLGRPRGSTFMQHENFQSISRSRAPSPTRLGWGGSHSHTSTPYVTGTRSRARSSASLYGSRAASSDNLAAMSAGAGLSSHFATGYERGADKDLPPDSSARYRGTLAKRLEGAGGRTGSAASAPPHEFAGSATFMVGDDHGRSRAPDRDAGL